MLDIHQDMFTLTVTEGVSTMEQDTITGHGMDIIIIPGQSLMDTVFTTIPIQVGAFPLVFPMDG